MAKINKKYWIDCYKGFLGEPKQNRIIFDELLTIITNKSKADLGIKKIKGSHIEVVIHNKDNASISGEIRKYRDDFLTVTNSVDKIDKELSLEEHESLVESNQFVFYRKHNILLFQLKKEACVVSHLEKYFQLMLNHEVVRFEKVLKKDAYEKLMENKQQFRKFEYTIARPANLDAYRSEPVWNKATLSQFAESKEINTISSMISIGLDGSQNNKFLTCFSLIQEVMKLNPSKAKVTNENHDVIDLFKAQLRTHVPVKADNLKMYRDVLGQQITIFWNEISPEIDTLFRK